MKRLVQTSNGWLEVDVNDFGHSLGVGVRATVFGADGWASGAETWVAEKPPAYESLPSFIARIAAIPTEEAVGIAEESLAGWRSRGGEGEDRPPVLGVMGFTAAMSALAAVGAATIVVAAAVAGLKLLRRF